MSLKDCPFCGKEMDEFDVDTLYPSGIFWEDFGDYRRYFAKHQNTGMTNPCYNIVCQSHAGGCGATIDGDSINEVIDKWNRRKNTC